MSFSGGLSQQPSSSFMPDFRGLSSTSAHVSMRLPRRRPPSWQPIFLLAYNLEWFHGRFHTDEWFALSWGTLPVLAGYTLQTNQISIGALLVAAAMSLLSLVEIKASRPYKALKRAPAGSDKSAEEHLQRYEAILKSISLGVILLGVGLASWRWLG